MSRIINYIVGLVGLSLIILDIFGISIGIGSYTVYVFASLIVVVKDFSKLKKAKLFGLEMEFEQETKELIERTIDVTTEVHREIENSSENTGLGGIENIKRVSENNIRYKLTPNYTTQIQLRESEIKQLVNKLFSLHNSQASVSFEKQIERLRDMDIYRSSYFDLIEKFQTLLYKYSDSEKLQENIKNYKKLDFIALELIQLTQLLIENTPTSRRRELN